ncbi:hypothetical protein ACFO9E_13535 [Streptomyces maoxianensis]|uniref:DUF916 domain-containing protein n=1 Tax=Streptomyces maoxianensis TaxID=1459942 RepID=A0ABV9G5L7_9ACTN
MRRGSLLAVVAALACALSAPAARAAGAGWAVDAAAGAGWKSDAARAAGAGWKSDADWAVEPGGGGRPYVYLEGVPGAVLEDKLSVTNPGAQPLTVRLRPADAYNTSSGSLAVRGAHRSTGAGTWITLASDRVTVPPRTRAEIPFSVTVPPGALPGDHPGAVMAAVGEREAGVRIHLRVSGPTLAALTVEDVRVFGGAIHYTLVNRGNTALTPRLTVRADGLFGQVLRRAPRTLPELLPAQRVTLTEKWPDHPSLDSVKVHVEASAADDARAGASASATFVPWGAVVGAAGALLAVAGGTALWWIRLRRSTGRERDGRSAEPADGQRELTEAAT